MCAKATMEEFEALLNESFDIDTPDEGSVVKGKVIAIESGHASCVLAAAVLVSVDVVASVPPAAAVEYIETRSASLMLLLLS